MTFKDKIDSLFGSLVAQTLEEKKSIKDEDASNDKSDDGEGMDKVDPKAVKKKFKDRKDKDIDNDGDVDSSDEYLHKRRKAVSKAVANEEVVKKSLFDIRNKAESFKKKVESVELDEESATISKVKEIVSKKQAMKIDGVMVDMFTASAISQIYDKVNDANKKKMDGLKITKLADVAMKLMKREELEEAAPKISMGKAKGSISATGLRGKGMKKFDVDVAVKNGKFEFRIKDEQGKFQTVGLKKAASMLGEETVSKLTHEFHEKTECPKCEGKGCDHCDNKGYHVESKKMALAKKLAKVSATSKKGKEKVTLKKAPWDKKETVNTEPELEEAKNYEYKDGKVHISKANFRKVHKDYKNATKGKERMMVLDPKTQASVSAPVVFTESSFKEKFKRSLTKRLSESAKTEEKSDEVANRYNELKQLAPVELMKLYQKHYGSDDLDKVKEMEKSELISKIVDKEFENQGEE